MESSLEKPEAQAQLYWLLARAFTAPQKGLLTRELVRGLRQALETLSGKAAKIEGELEAMEACLAGLQDPTELAVEYTRLFRGPGIQAHPYESIYRNGEIMGRTTQEVVACYKQAGLAISPDAKELPDHIVAELEFMCYLSVQELEARHRGDEEEATYFRQERHSFSRDHLAWWLPLFAERIAQSSTSPFYRSLAELVRYLTTEQILL